MFIMYFRFYLCQDQQYNQVIVKQIQNCKMQEDLLILKLLKIPVTVIKYTSRALAILTYLPNYLVILLLDSIIFNQSLTSTLLLYIVSWPFRLLSLFGVILVFCAQFYYLYVLLSISHLHWGIQIALVIVASQALLALMRHGYLSMISKFSPKKLKSPMQHLRQFWYIIVDIFGIVLTLVNMVLIINIPKTLSYNYSPKIAYNYIKHISKLIHKSILDLIKLFYIKIFFKIFPWRFVQGKQNVDKQSDNILQLTVLLTLLYLFTLLDLLCIAVFGIFGILHPRRKIFIQSIAATHEKYKAVLKFAYNSIIQLLQVIILVFCLPFKFNYAKQVLRLVLAKQNDYKFHYVPQTLFVFRLALIKIPSLICQLVLLLSVYKFKKINYLRIKDLEKMASAAEAAENQPLFEKKMEKAAPKQQQKTKKKSRYSKQYRYRERQYLVFDCFGSLMLEIPMYPIILISTLIKIWNLGWLKFLVNDQHDLRASLIMSYFFKNLKDYLYFIPLLLTTLTLGFYDPAKQKYIFQTYFSSRRELIQNIPAKNQNIEIQKLKFYSAQQAILPKITRKNDQEIRKDILFLPTFIAARLSLMSLMGCEHPSNSVQLFQCIWMLFYIKRVKRSPFFEQYLQILKADQAAGMIKTSRVRLRFWKFAHKSIRHRYIHKIISFLLPKKRAQKAIVNAKIEKNYSAISNHYWHCYNITWSLLGYLLAFVIQIIVTLIGIIIMMPLTLWRMPTFFILMKIHQFKKRMFFKVLFKMYKQMALDIVYLIPKIVVLLFFPRASITFYLKNSLRYTKKGIDQFQKIQDAKSTFVFQHIFFDGLTLYLLLLKIIFVKILWIRKRDMNLELKSNKIRLSQYVFQFLTTPQKIPNVEQLSKIFGFFEQTAQQAVKQQKQTKYKKMEKYSGGLEGINQKGLKINSIVSVYVQKTKQDIPYLLLMVFLVVTLPWRIFYIKNAILLLRDDNNGKQQFNRLVRTIAKDYKCIFLYIVLLLSIVKTKRAIQLFYRNFKINFYVGVLRYSHLKQLQNQLYEALYFYYSIILIVFSCVFGPYRIAQIYRDLKNIYDQYRDKKYQQKLNKKIYENTIKQGKSLQLITTIGHNSLMHVFRFLNAQQLTRMTQVSKYMYDSVKERDEVWMEHWQRIYQTKYPTYQIKNQTGSLSYNSMCVSMYRSENANKANKQDTLREVALNQYNKSLYETTLDLKVQLKKVLPESVYDKIFHSLRWSFQDGYGPEDNWPRPDDNQELLDLMNIQRRQVVQLEEEQAMLSWLFERPVQFVMVRLNRFYGNTAHRKKKQLLFAFSIICTPFFLLFVVFSIWDWFWQFTVFIGYKFLTVTYLIIFVIYTLERVGRQYTSWQSINPFDVKQDIIRIINQVKNWVKNTAIKVGQFVKQKGDKYVVKPTQYVFGKIKTFLRWLGRRIKYAANLFVEKVAKPLYISISHKIVALWIIAKDIYKAFVISIKAIFRFFKKVLVNIYNVIFSIVKSISKFYSDSLELSLRFALKFGMLGQLIFTIVGIACMVSPSIICYKFFWERWFIIFSTILTILLMVTGYKHLNRMKSRVLAERK